MVRLLSVVFAFSAVFSASYAYAAKGDVREIQCMYRCGATVGDLKTCQMICAPD